MEDFANITQDAPVTQDAPEMPRQPRKLAATPRAPKADPVGPVQPKALTAKDASDPRKVADFIKAMRIYNDALKASKPRGTKQPVISDKIKALFFANPTMSSEDVARKTGTKLVTVKTFRGDAVNTFKNAAEAGMLSPAGKKWLEANRRK